MVDGKKEIGLNNKKCAQLTFCSFFELLPDDDLINQIDINFNLEEKKKSASSPSYDLYRPTFCLREIDI